MTVYNVPLVSQPNGALCSIACGAMMWAWLSVEKHGQVPNVQSIIGPALAAGTGLDEKQLEVFYAKLKLTQLGGGASKVPSIRRATGANVRYALKWSPVIVLIEPLPGQSAGHAIVVVGHEGDSYTVADPAGQQSMNFATGGSDYAAAYTTLPTGRLDRAMARVIWYWT